MEHGAINITAYKTHSCKYGENPWQKPAGLYTYNIPDPLAFDNFLLIEGDTPSFNNLCDMDRLLQTITHIAAAYDVNKMPTPLIAVGVKHGNACGAAVGEETIDVLEKMVMGDPLAIFGGVVMTNFPINAAEAECLRRVNIRGDQKRLLDAVIAPLFSEDAKAELNRKGGKCRMLANPALAALNRFSLDTNIQLRPVRGGCLLQPNYTFVLDLADPCLERWGTLTPSDESMLLFAWAIGSTSNSNTVTLVRNRYLIGNGVGQQDRVGAACLAIERAVRSGHYLKGAIAYSDSFFPFIDGPEALADAGIKAILSSSGSVKDDEVRKFCQSKGISLCLIPDTRGRGFFGG